MPAPVSPVGPVAHSRLTVDLAAVAENYRRVKAAAGGAEVAAVLKGDAYGLGMAQLAAVLAAEGTATFCVAFCDEAAALRAVLRDLGADGRIYVLTGLHDAFWDRYLADDLIPVLNSPDHVAGWARAGRDHGVRPPAAIQVDLGLHRLGLSPDELTALAARPEALSGLTPDLLIGHLPFGNDHGDPRNGEHLALFRKLCAGLPGWRRSIANSAAVFLAPDYHLDLVRTGSALCGVNPRRGAANPMRPVVTLESRVIQVRDLPAGRTIGYRGTFRAARDTRLGIVAIGSSDGFGRQFTGDGQGIAWIAGHEVAIIGAGGSDMIFVDLTDLPAEAAAVGQPVELLGPHIDLEAAARRAGTTEYDLLTGLGRRPERVYLSPSGA